MSGPAREQRVCPVGPPGTDGYDKPITTLRPLVFRLEAHAGFLENGGVCEHQITDECALLREAAARIEEMLDALKEAEQLFKHTFAENGRAHKKMIAAIAKAEGR